MATVGAVLVAHDGPVRAQAVSDAVPERVEARAESTATQALERRVEANVAQAVEERMRGTVARTLEKRVEGKAAERVQDSVQATVNRRLRERVPQEDVTREAGTMRTFARALDEDGRTIERGTWVMLIESTHVARIRDWGLTVKRRQPLPHLGLVLVHLEAPANRDLARAARQFAHEAPGTVVDYNHMYRTQDGADTTAGDKCTAANERTWSPAASAGVAVGIVDTAVAAEHPALAGSAIVQKDFVPFDGVRPRDHGTAVASILVGQSENLQGLLAGARLYAASVFFQDESGAAGATTASLVEALAWMSEAGVPVVNMSLSGPPNRLLQTVIERMTAGGTVIVAAVGNNGPAGEPLYPAAHDSVVGVTAVDACHRIFRYANRGHHVAFAAPGVEVPVALADGGYGRDRGTSMASPYAAAVIAAALSGAADSAGVIDRLKVSALDLGDRGFDEVFGYGLIAPPR